MVILIVLILEHMFHIRQEKSRKKYRKRVLRTYRNKYLVFYECGRIYRKNLRNAMQSDFVRNRWEIAREFFLEQCRSDISTR